MTKTCTKCKKEKPVSEYYKLETLKDGLVSSCKECYLAHGKKYDAIFRKTPRGGAYISWSNMKQRCFNPKSPMYKHYNGRGISICPRWLEPKEGFENFLSDMGGRPPGMTLDRIYNDGNYEPSNCRWSSKAEQQLNKTNSLKYKGECSTEASKRLGGSKCLVSMRIRQYGWSIKKAFTTPAKFKSE